MEGVVGGVSVVGGVGVGVQQPPGGNSIGGAGSASASGSGPAGNGLAAALRQQQQLLQHQQMLQGSNNNNQNPKQTDLQFVSTRNVLRRKRRSQLQHGHRRLSRTARSTPSRKRWRKRLGTDFRVPAVRRKQQLGSASVGGGNNPFGQPNSVSESVFPWERWRLVRHWRRFRQCGGELELELELDLN